MVTPTDTTTYTLTATNAAGTGFSLQRNANPGYAVFGKVVSGLDVINAIGAVPTGITNGMSDVPTTEILVISITRIK